jgi:hypothetical protein
MVPEGRRANLGTILLVFNFYLHALNLCQDYYDFFRAVVEASAEMQFADILLLGARELNVMAWDFCRVSLSANVAPLCRS